MSEPRLPDSLFSPFQQVFRNFWNMPITSWQRFFNPQFIFNYNAGDVGIESHVLGRAGSYGKQMGVLLDAVDLLITRARLENLSEAEQQTLDALRLLRLQVRDAKREYRDQR